MARLFAAIDRSIPDVDDISKCWRLTIFVKFDPTVQDIMCTRVDQTSVSQRLLISNTVKCHRHMVLNNRSLQMIVCDHGINLIVQFNYIIVFKNVGTFSLE